MTMALPWCTPVCGISAISRNAPGRLFVNIQYLHNHNPGFPTNPSYDVQLQLDSGAGFVNVCGLLNLSSANSGNRDTMGISEALPPGTYTLRWVPQKLSFGADTNTEFFAMDDLIFHYNIYP